MSNHRVNLSEEFRLVPWFAIALALVAFGCVQWLFNVFMLVHEKNPPPLAFRVPMGIFVGALVTVYILLVGYVNRDAKRRGMNRVLWTLLVIFIPNALGFILYFFVRQPLVAKCPQCQESVQAGFNYCPKCRYALAPMCPGCNRPLQPEFANCPYCGRAVEGNAPVQQA